MPPRAAHAPRNGPIEPRCQVRACQVSHSPGRASSTFTFRVRASSRHIESIP